jgi:ABC-type Co2+ transport system permease subunit
MHIPDAILDPQVAMATSVLGGAGLFHALRV